MGHIYLSHSHPIAIYACPIPWDVSNGIPIGIPFPWTSLPIRVPRIENRVPRIRENYHRVPESKKIGSLES